MAGPLNLEQIISFLLDTPMFRDLDPKELSQIVHIMQVQHLRPGQQLFTDGEPGEAWYVLYGGEVEVLKERDGEEAVIARLTPKSCFGEMAILDGSPRSATVRATIESTAFRFPRREFTQLLMAENLAAFKLIHQMALVLVTRQRQTNLRLMDLLRKANEQVVKDSLEPIVEEFSLTE